MKPFSQEYKHAYIHEFFRQLHSQIRSGEEGLHIEDMVGSIFYEEKPGQSYVYITPACAHYLGGDDVPDDNNVGIAVCRSPIDGDYEDLGVIDFPLTYDFHRDLMTYFGLVVGFRMGAVKPIREVA